MDKMILYRLSHIHEYGEDGNEDVEIKMLGIYSTLENATKASERYYLLPGFNCYSKECFMIDEYVVDEDSEWKEGFIGTDKIRRDFEKITACFNKWLEKDVGIEESWNDENYYNALCKISYLVFKPMNACELAEQIRRIWLDYFADEKSFEEYLHIAKTLLIEVASVCTASVVETCGSN